MLIVETGSIVPGANSFVTRQEYITYADSVNVYIRDDIDADVDLIKAAQFIASKEGSLQGTKVTRDQPMPFPRYGVVVDGWPWEGGEIPRQVILAQMMLALDIREGIDLYNPPVNPSIAVKSERVEGAVAVEYAIDGGGQKLSRTSKAEAMLNSLLRRAGLYMIPIIK